MCVTHTSIVIRVGGLQLKGFLVCVEYTKFLVLRLQVYVLVPGYCNEQISNSNKNAFQWNAYHPHVTVLGVSQTDPPPFVDRMTDRRL